VQKRDANGEGEVKKFLGRFIVEKSGKVYLFILKTRKISQSHV